MNRTTEATPFARWLDNPQQRFARNPVGDLGVALHDDPLEPNPADLDELRCYLVSVGACAETQRGAAEAWALYQCTRHGELARSVAEYAEQWSEDGEPITMPVAELLEELEYEVDDAAVEAARRLLCDLAPWLIMAHSTTVRVEAGMVTLDYGAAERLPRAPRYCRSHEARV